MIEKERLRHPKILLLGDGLPFLAKFLRTFSVVGVVTIKGTMYLKPNNRGIMCMLVDFCIKRKEGCYKMYKSSGMLYNREWSIFAS